MPTTLLFLTSNTNPFKTKNVIFHRIYSDRCLKFSPTSVRLSSSNANSLLWRWRSVHTASILPSSIFCPWHLTNEWVDNVHMWYDVIFACLPARSLAHSFVHSHSFSHHAISQQQEPDDAWKQHNRWINDDVCVCTRVSERDVATSQKVNTCAYSHTHTHIDQHRALPYVKRPAASWFSLLSSVLDNAIFETILNSFSCDLDLVLDHSLLVVAPNFSHVTWHLP